MFDTLGALFLSLLLKKIGICNENSQLNIAKILLKHLLQINMNSIQIIDQKITDITKLENGEYSYRIKLNEESVGIGLYKCMSLVNHSCYNVTKSLFNGSELCLVSNCSFQNGDEITYNYGPHFKQAKKDERQQYLSDLYYFQCQCKACDQNWC
ncbi:histone-lysine N-methyltransferase SMYD3-like protein [Leptotrombidium deliense]|uniref:Histone-lysine N-methyltransferase SMYD3-like protein n=1 Tax=Leptotrombidium deliense TaxID=299467 RepID=A0A443S8U6_9ACAR|nr:histone-lysine N-methyltransferase SMYD3-like protein [Leptotrombidium deliense]